MALIFSHVTDFIAFFSFLGYKMAKQQKQGSGMKIINIPYEEFFYVTIGKQTVKVVTFPTTEFGNIKFGIEASREVQIHREEIYETIKNQKKAELVD